MAKSCLLCAWTSRLYWGYCVWGTVEPWWNEVSFYLWQFSSPKINILTTESACCRVFALYLLENLFGCSVHKSVRQRAVLTQFVMKFQIPFLIILVENEEQWGLRCLFLLQYFCLGQASDRRERYIGAAKDRSGLWPSLAHVEEAHEEIYLVWKKTVS